MEEQDEKTRLARCAVLTSQAWDSKKYEFDTSFRPWDGATPLGVHTTPELLQCLEKNASVELDAKVLGAKNGQIQSKSISRQQFRESFSKDPWKNFKFREGGDFFATHDNVGGSGPFVGQDFTPLLGGPFYKNLYYYQDYIRMHSEAFFAYHNDPIANFVIKVTRDFVLGTGYEMQCDTNTPEGKLAIAAWKMFEEANEFQEQVDQFVIESGVYGESMLWELPGNQSKITYQLGLGDKPPVGIIPRVRLMDPSNFVEIVTYPEDITRPLFYVWLVPTQYQIYTSGTGFPSGPNGLTANVSTSTPIQPTLKFIYRQVPADQIMHFKVNSVSNEKRGRSDLFPIFAYLKRLRDSVDYALIGLQKASAWAIDTQIDGDQTDIDAYIQAQRALGTIPNAGSEFVHSKAIVRTLLATQSRGGMSDAFAWAFNMICAGSGIPLNYFGTHLSGGSTRASALVATEPVAKKMEKRREFVKRMLRRVWALVMKRAGLPDVDCDIIFPEIITQDRSQKLKDILLMQQSRWIKPDRAAELAAKEMQIQNFDYESELQGMKQELPEVPFPLLDPGKIGTGPMQTSPEQEPGVNALTSQDKKDVRDDDTEL